MTGQARQALLTCQVGPLRHLLLYTRLRQDTLESLAGLKPKLLAIMRGSSFKGNGERALQDLSKVCAAIWGAWKGESRLLLLKS